MTRGVWQTLTRRVATVRIATHAAPLAAEDAGDRRHQERTHRDSDGEACEEGKDGGHR